MGALILGLVLFLGMHSTRVVADGWRTRMVARVGDKGWKGIYTLVSVIGFVLILWGYAAARQDPVVLWSAPPTGVRHLVALLVLVAFILLAAAYVPRNHLQARVGHPMVLATKVWAFAHLIANNTLADVLLFGGFLLWSVVAFASLRRRDRAAGRVVPPGTVAGTLGAVVVGAVLWAVFAFWLHEAWIKVRPLG